MFNQELQDLLRQHVLSRPHGVLRVGKHARLEDEGEVWCSVRNLCLKTRVNVLTRRRHEIHI